ncbi:DUF3307 domain-containing protein [Streptomyces caniscabiei]|uniref:DUF3307 domain-containing protein n=1 Tax=Streptomyces caniscabiei TaxID=2746961 RepID=UPI0023DAEA75|nr:DUF3307 domain-containing protein [Streptomyces caniscabiei]MDX3509165.1 DUF3307 domain-containing protein [Streptomyces caniscabiei]MDX3717082.1 DUF3307 domain-containing protein [Streptomyces caniscabiei]WEO22950.1 DUF3307 domain-containing protein [Streptomyces caniscabiei]
MTGEIAFGILLAHLAGDYLIQSDWMANEKTKHFLAPRSYWHPWSECSATGYHQDRPAWLAVWLMIIADNTIHLVINAAAVTWL